MRLSTWALSALSIYSLAAVADNASSVYYDPLTGFTFASWSAKYNIDGRSIMYRTAVPSNVANGAPYDVVLQIVAPIDVGWCGFAWNGQMTQNPLSVAWQNGNTVMISSRMAASHTTPTPYSGATYQVLKTGTRVNFTHWQITTKCSGCTHFSSTTLSPTSTHRIAWAYSSARPANPSSNTSSITAHDVHDYWNQDFAAGANPSFTALVTKNS